MVRPRRPGQAGMLSRQRAGPILGAMHELRRTNDLVFLSYAQALLRAEGLNPVVLDAGMAVMDGSIGALPRRLMVPDSEAEAAMKLLAELDAAPPVDADDRT